MIRIDYAVRGRLGQSICGELRNGNYTPGHRELSWERL